MSSNTSSIRTVRRVIAVALTVIFAMTFTTVPAVGDTGGDFGACENGLWLKADWNGEGWDWESGPAWDGDAPTFPDLDVTSKDDGDPVTVDWTSDTYVQKVRVKASTEFADFAGGYSGTVTGIDRTENPDDGQHAISNIVFCYLDLGSLTVHKVVEGVADGDPVFDIEFVIDSTSEVHALRAGEYLAYYDLHEGTSWRIKETTTGGADSVSYSVDGVPVTPDGSGYVTGTISTGQDVLVTITNTYESPPTGSLTVEKVVVGDYDGPDFDFAGTCQLPQFPAHATFSLADGGSWTFPQDIPGYLDGSPCTFEETDTNGADSVTYKLGATELTPDTDGKVHFDLSSTEDLVLTVTNTFATEPPPPPPTPEPDVPDIGLTKTPDVTTITFDPDDGDDEIVTYTYVITNTGETALSDITLVDDVLGTITLTDTDLAVGESMEVEATHVVTTDDAAAGEIVNTAETTGTAPDDTEVTDTADATVLVQEVAPLVVLKPEITLEKSALVTPDADGNKIVIWNAATPTETTITYEYVITNTGESALSGITLVDDVLGTITLTDTDLGVGESMTVTAVHTVAEADAVAGSVTNLATTTGTDPEGTEVTDTAEETVLVGEVQAEVVEDEEELPVTGAASLFLALLATFSLVTGTGLLRASRRRK